MKQTEPLFQAITGSFSVLLNLPEGIMVTLLGIFGFAGECKPMVHEFLAHANPKNVVKWNSP